MKNMSLIIGILAAALLFGCLGGPSTPTDTSTGTETGTTGVAAGTGSSGEQTGTGTTGVAAGTGGSGSSEQTGTETNGVAAGTGGTEDGEKSLVDTTIEAIMQLGMPYECTATVTGEGMTAETHYWVNGKNVYIEVVIPELGNMKQVMIVKDDNVYMKAGAGTVYSQLINVPGFEDCEWLYYSTKTTETVASNEPTSPSGMPTSTYSPDVKVTCNPAVFGDEKFATSGKVCDLNDLIKSMQTPAYG